jgi:hypothetical protein
MGNQHQNQAIDIFTEYVRLRHSGWTMEDAVRDLQPLADQISKGQRQQLGQMVQNWEAREGGNFKGIPRHSERSTKPVFQPPPGAPPFGTKFLDASKLPAPTNQVQKPEATTSGIRRIQPGNQPPTFIRPIEPMAPAADPSQRMLCPHCGKPNLKRDSYCYACGHILAAGPKTPATKALEDDMDPKTRWGTAHFGPSSVLVLQVRGAQRLIEVPAQAECIIGRSAEDSAMKPDIDLADYDADNLGVSRLHAVLKRQQNTIAISDLDSKNFTFINGQRLHPHEVRVLRNGDEIRLGKLVLKVGFKHQIRRI